MPRGVYPHKRGPESPHWKPDDAIAVSTGRWRAGQVLYPGKHVCQKPRCGAQAQRHHVDGNPRNNAPSNIEFWCPKHHVEREDRMNRPAILAARERRKVRKAARLAAKRAARTRRGTSAASLANLRVQQSHAPKSAAHRAALKGCQVGRPGTKWSAARRATFSASKRELNAQKKAAS